MSQSTSGLLPIYRSENQLRLMGQLVLHPDREQTVPELLDHQPHRLKSNMNMSISRTNRPGWDRIVVALGAA